jgi:hypothetical protein
MYLTDNIFLLQAMVFGHEPSLIELFVETHVWSDDHQKRVQQFVNSRAQYFVVCWLSIFFLSYYFLEFNEFIFYFHDTYNSRWKERYNIIAAGRRDTWTILRPIRISI